MCCLEAMSFQVHVPSILDVLSLFVPSTCTRGMLSMSRFPLHIRMEPTKGVAQLVRSVDVPQIGFAWFGWWLDGVLHNSL